MNLQTALRTRLEKFYAEYGPEIEQIAELLAIQLRQLALAYTIEHNLPREAVRVIARVKSLSSSLRKLERLKWPAFYYPTEVLNDLIGARVVVWFLSDVYGMVAAIRGSHHFKAVDDKILPQKDYIAQPQIAGYRAIHVFTEIIYDRIARTEQDAVTIVPANILCEIQLRTKLQDAWADVTHEFFYKAKNFGIMNKAYESLLADISERLCVEDKTFIKFRDFYKKLVEETERAVGREGFKDEHARSPTLPNKRPHPAAASKHARNKSKR